MIFLEESNELSDSWREVERIYVKNSNVELIRYKSRRDRMYRIKVKKINDSIFGDSIDDQLSITFTKK